MTADATTAIANLLDPALVERGFVREGRNWYREHLDSILLINLQPATHAAGPYVNFGVYYRRYGRMAARPRADDCQLLTRLEGVIPLADALRLDDLVNPGSELPETERHDTLQRLVLTYGLPWLEGLVRFDGARDFLALRTSEAVHIAPSARSDLRGPPGLSQ
jgi:hypothetical protein